MTQHSAAPISRRRFLKTAGSTALAAGAGPAIIIPGRAQPKTLKVLLLKEFVPSYNRWFAVYAKAWGEKTDTQVILNWIPIEDGPRRMKEQASAQKGHDLLFIGTAAEYEDQVIDHRELYEECERRYGKALDLAVKRSYNPKSSKYHGLCLAYLPNVVIYRKDLWDEVGVVPESWETIRSGGRRIKFYQGHPVGLGLRSNQDSEGNLRSLLYAFGASVQDAEQRPALKSPQTLEALKFLKVLYEEAMSKEVLGWDLTSNNRAMLAGEISLALNPISITRTAENKHLAVNEQLWLGAMPRGPAGRFGVAAGVLPAFIWNFADNIASAQQFLIDFVGDYRQGFVAGQFYYFPTFPQTVPDLVQLLADDRQARPPGKYRLLGGAQDWTVTVGYPGYGTAPALDIYYNTGLITAMFANAATGQMTPEQALTQADQEVRKIYDKWRALGKV